MMNERFGRLVVIGEAPRDRKRNRKLKVRCDCGVERVVWAHGLTSGQTQSCGCLQRERSTKHGMSGYPEYGIWASMISRCENPNDPGFKNYGGRGIRVCERWRLSFAAFISDVGRRPSLKHSVDRYPNNDGDYRPDNVRWATQAEQSRNTRRSRQLTVRGETLPLTDWAERAGLPKSTLWGRLNRGMSAEEALFGGSPSPRESARRRRSTRWITAWNETLCLAEWSERTGVSKDTIRYRLSRGLPSEIALSNAPLKRGPKLQRPTE